MCNYELLGEDVEYDNLIYPKFNRFEDKEFNIWVCPHTKEPLYPVFKVYYGFNASNHYGDDLEFAKMCRIRMDIPEYVGLYDEDLILTRELKEKFISIVYQNWKYCINMMNDAAYLIIKNDKNFMDINSIIPNYELLKTID